MVRIYFWNVFLCVLHIINFFGAHFAFLKPVSYTDGQAGLLHGVYVFPSVPTHNQEAAINP